MEELVLFQLLISMQNELCFLFVKVESWVQNLFSHDSSTSQTTFCSWEMQKLISLKCLRFSSKFSILKSIIIKIHFLGNVKREETKVPEE